ncbi:HAD family hydrolase [Streptomyces roseolus]
MVFDCDGVLVDTERLAVRPQIALGAEPDRPLTADDSVERLVGRSRVASSGSHEKTRHALGRTGPYDPFAGRIHSASEVARGKPVPDPFPYAARRMGADPVACAVVEGSGPGVAAARTAGTRAFGYGGRRPPSGSRGRGPSSSTACAHCRACSPGGDTRSGCLAGYVPAWRDAYSLIPKGRERAVTSSGPQPGSRACRAVPTPPPRRRRGGGGPG